MRRLPWAMAATAPGEKNYRAPPCEELDPPYDIKLVLVQKITFVLRKINKNCYHKSCTFDSNMNQIVCRLGHETQCICMTMSRMHNDKSKLMILMMLY